MTNAEATSKALWEYVQTMAADEFKDVHVLALHVHGPGVIHTVEKPVRSVNDVKGLKLRAPTRQATKLLASLGLHQLACHCQASLMRCPKVRFKVR